MDAKEILAYNRRAWNANVERGNPWTIPVSTEDIEKARNGVWQVLLTPQIPVPRDWFPPLQGIDVLCLASSGGQQAPIFAAAGANVTVLDNSEKQLEQDQKTAGREGLTIRTVLGDMAELSMFDDGQFDFVFHPTSNCFVETVRPVWNETYRVLRKGGILLAGFANPLRYLFRDERTGNGELSVYHRIPYSDAKDMPEPERRALQKKNEPLEFGHTLDDQIGGQLDAGFIITGFFEDRFSEDDVLSDYIATFIATRAIKLSLASKEGE